MAGSSDNGESRRRGPGRPFRPGQSGNPNGRPKGSEGLAKYIREQTTDFFELADIALSIARGRKKFEEFVGPQAIKIKRRPNATERMAAVKWLADRGAGTAQAFIEVTGAGGGPLAITFQDLQGLSDEQLAQMESILASAKSGGASPGDGEGGESETSGGKAT